MKCASSPDFSIKPMCCFSPWHPQNLPNLSLILQGESIVFCFFVFFLCLLWCKLQIRKPWAFFFFFFLVLSPHAKGCSKGKSTTFLEQETSWTLFPSDILNSLWGLWNKHRTALEQDSQSCHSWDQAVWTLEMSSMLYSPGRCQERCGFLVLPTRVQVCLLQVLTL